MQARTVVDDPVGVALPTDPDALEHTVASQLVHDLGEGGKDS